MQTDFVLDGSRIQIIEFDYINYRFEQSHRKAVIYKIKFGSNEWHAEHQWLMVGLDINKGEFREFAMKDMTNIQSFPAIS